MIEKAIAILQQAGFDFTGRELAEILWLAIHIEPSTSQSKTQLNSQPPQLPSPIQPSQQTAASVQEPSEPTAATASIYLPSAKPSPLSSIQQGEATPMKIPAAAALRNSLALGRALRPLMRKVPSPVEKILDEEATVYRIAEEKVYSPVLKPIPERWLELALVVEQTSITNIWKQTIRELQKLLKYHGAFRDVRTWQLKVNDSTRKVELFSQNSAGEYNSIPQNPKILIDSQGRRLILLLSDCISPTWRDGLIHPLLDLWGRKSLITILQLLPERLWHRTALSVETPVLISSLQPVVNNSQLIDKIWNEDDVEQDKVKVNDKVSVPFPIITLEPEYLLIWSQVIAGQGNLFTAGFRFKLSPQSSQPTQESHQISAGELVTQFRATASLQARRLAGLMATVPVNISVVHIIQNEILPESRQIHVAEVFMSGLVKLPQDTNCDYIEFDFVEGVRELLLNFLPMSQGESVLEKISESICKRFGLSVAQFEALLVTPSSQDAALKAQLRPFARIKAQVLRHWGGKYTQLAAKLEAFSQGIEYVELQKFSFEVVTVNRRGEIIKRENKIASYFTENLENGISLEMVAIPGGKFMMGSPQGEGDEDEYPQHEVSIQPFFMGKYLVTQEQWKAVAALPKVERDLKPEASGFKGENNLPVERVSWFDAVEFCARLSKETKKSYRLPSEAEWEYACRAGTTTPFHFGETITGKLGNYDTREVFADESKVEYRDKTTPVGIFYPNAFGLYDMHGNLWEWVLDDWHKNYEGCPLDDNAWINERLNNNDDAESIEKLLRGGSWLNYPHNCRAANRNRYNPDFDDSFGGFRVVCVLAART